MKRQQLFAPRALSRLIQNADACWQRQDYQQYFALMERASRMDPANHGLLLDRGAAHGKRYDYAAAERCFEQAVRLAPNRGEALAMAGVHCRGFTHYQMARHYFERANQEKNASPDTMAKLAELYERFRLLDDASALVDRALQMDGDCVLALLVRARLERLAGKNETAEKTVRSFLTKSDPPTWSTRIRGWYELGAVLDAQGRYEEAMQAFQQAKAMIRPNAPPYLVAQRTAHARLKEAETDISVDVLRRWSEAGQALAPACRLALLCGHPRSGTTLLEQVLDSHPAIRSAEETVVFFHDAYLPLRRGGLEDAPMLASLESASAGCLRQLRDTYLGCMEKVLGEPLGERLLLDKNPSLTTLIPAFARVFPEAKFLVALRDPRDVCLSCFMQPLPLGQVSAMYLDLGTTVEEYAATMGLWVALAPRLPKRALEVRYEALVEDLESATRPVLEFLGVAWDASVLRFNEHARQKLVRSPTYAEVTKPVFKGAVGRWRNYQKYLEPCLAKLEPFVKAFGYA
jgi:tetratricopeptide (TPR) repeat protein